jgi:hypothetical protein
METIAQTIENLGDQPPELVMPALARALAAGIGGRPGMVRTLFFEVTGLAPETQEAARYAMGRGLGNLLGYLSRQMEQGNLRSIHPLLAAQAFAGPLLVQITTRDVAAQMLGVEIDLQAAAVTLAELWVRAMKPDQETL